MPMHAVTCGLFPSGSVSRPGFSHGGAQVSHPRLGDLRRQAREEDSELIPAQAREHVAFTHRQPEAVRHLAEHAIRVHQARRSD